MRPARPLSRLRVLSGGQTGVDRAALDVARDLGLPAGGWCPRGRLAEDGPIGEDYPLRETPEASYTQRTEWNVRDADGTLIVIRDAPTGGTAQTIAVARRMRKPVFLVLADRPPDPAAFRKWVADRGIRTLNVAGPRESTTPGIYRMAVEVLGRLFGGR